MHTTSPRIWSPQQAAFIEWAINGKGSAVLEAVAGAGKTTVLLEAAEKMPGQVAICAYNKKIADEIKSKLQARGIDWKKAQAGTVHSFGFSAIRKSNANVKVEGFKVANMIEAVINPRGDQFCNHPLWPYRSEVAKLVSLAKQSALGIVGGAISDTHVWLELADHFDVFDADDNHPPVDAVIKLAQDILLKSNQITDVVDFDDMVYLPLVHKMRFWRFDVVMIDEIQDLNASRRALVRALVKQGGRLIGVGDRNQSCYGFQGADADSMDLTKRDFNAIELPLTITYRCPKAVVDFAHQWVSHIEAADAAPQGSVTSISFDDLLARKDLNGEAAILSRVNKPLVSLAFKLIRQRIPCRVEGREIGNGIKKLLTRWKVKSLDALEDKLATYLARETTKLLAKKKETRLAEIEDQVETARVIIDQCRIEKKYSVDDAVAYVDALFADDVSKMLTLSSIHRAKGREWQRVFWLDRANTCPSKWARAEWQQNQERNLQYICATRAQDQLIEVLVEKQD